LLLWVLLLELLWVLILAEEQALAQVLALEVAVEEEMIFFYLS
jgi:hypothetical protein